MIDEQLGIKEIIFGISNDSLNFETILIFSQMSIDNVKANKRNLHSILHQLLILTRNNYGSKNKYFRLDIIHEKGKLTIKDFVDNEDHEIKFSPLSSIKTLAIQKFVLLTPKEKQLIKLISQKQKQAEIISKMNITLNTFKTHKKNIFNKMSFKDCDDLIEWSKLNSDFLED